VPSIGDFLRTLGRCVDRRLLAHTGSLRGSHLTPVHTAHDSFSRTPTVRGVSTHCRYRLVVMSDALGWISFAYVIAWPCRMYVVVLYSKPPTAYSGTGGHCV
jgi:hypothetical protein